jgi:hypothetical protein
MTALLSLAIVATVAAGEVPLPPPPTICRTFFPSLPTRSPTLTAREPSAPPRPRACVQQ